MRLWTIQGIEIYEQLQRDGVAYCTKPTWGDDEKFMKAYRWMADEMRQRIGEPPMKEIKYQQKYVRQLDITRNRNFDSLVF